MKKLGILGLGLLAFVMLAGAGCSKSGSVSSTKVELGVGSIVASKSWDDNYYLGNITAINGDQYHVKYSAGDEEDVTKDDLVAIQNKIEDLKAGDAVSATYTDSGRFYNGKVKEVTPTGVLITWDDGSGEDMVPFGKVVKGALGQ